jgi:SAM-dependent methyltransferase
MKNVWGDDEFVIALNNQLKHNSPVTRNEMFDYGRINLVDELIDIKKSDVILDIGCGNGSTLQKYHYAHYLVGVDISNLLCRNAKNNLKNGEIVLASMEHLPFRNNTFDKIIAVYSVLYSSQEKTFSEISRLLKDNGAFVLYDPNKLSMRTVIRKFIALKLRLSGDVNNPRYIHHSIATQKAMSYWDFKRMGKDVHLTIDTWCGVFSYHMIIPEKFYPFLFSKFHYKQWGFIAGIKFFSDFLLIKFIKEPSDKDPNKQ